MAKKQNRALAALGNVRINEASDEVQEELRNQEGIIIHDDGTVEFIGFQVHRLGVEIDDSVTESTWNKFGQILAKIAIAWEWIVADWLAYGDHKYGDQVYKTASELFGKTASTWEDYAYVARNVKISERSEILGVFNHKPVASYKDDPDLQRELIDLAVTHKLSKKDFERIIPLYLDGKDWQLLLPEKLGVFGKAELKQEDERNKIRKKITGKNGNKWIEFARKQANEWQRLLDEIAD